MPQSGLTNDESEVDERVLTPKPDQVAAIERVVSEPTRAALLAAETGFGKTLAAIEVARQLNAQTILVIAPLKTFDEEGWVGTITGQETGLPIKWINPKNLANFDALVAGEPGWYLVGREFFALSGSSAEPKVKKKFGRPVVIDGVTQKTAGRKARWSWSRVNKKLDLAIYDEVQAVANRDSAGFLVLKQLKPGFKVAMSATPGRNNFGGLWSPCRWLWPTATNAAGDLIVDNSKDRWMSQWCTTEADPFASGDNYTKYKITGELDPGAFVATLPCYLRYEAPKVVTHTRKVHVDLSPAQRAMYTNMERDALVWLGEHPLVADLPLTQKMRLRQIGLGEITLNEAGQVDFALDCVSAKADACEVIRTKHHPGEQIMFYTSSQKFARVLAARLPGAVEWSGAVKREGIKERFIAGDIRYIVATIQSIGEGTNGLQRVCNVEVWLDEVFDNMLNIQCAGRLNRTGQSKPITSYRLLAGATDDNKTFEKLVASAAAMRASLATGGTA